MSFRRRIVLLSAAAVAAAIVVASVIVYVVTGGQLRGQVDANLRQMVSPGPRGVQIHTVSLSKSEKRKLEKAGELLTQAPSASATVRGHVRFGETGGLTGGGSARSASGGSAHATGGRSQTGPNVVFHGEAVPLPEQMLRAQELGGVKQMTKQVPDFPGNGVGEAVGFGSATIVGAEGENVRVATLMLPTGAASSPGGLAQLVFPGRVIVKSFDGGRPRSLRITAATHEVAKGRRRAFFSDLTLGGVKYRELTAPAKRGGVWQVALPLASVEGTLSHLLIVLAIVSLGGVLIAAALGLLVSRAALAPVRRLTRVTEQIAKTEDLAHRIPEGESDELGRLAVSFNTMLAALERSRLAQRRLVSDASHELRTPLTSIQANLDALSLDGALSRSERSKAVASAQAQLRELTALMGDLIDLSKTEVEDLEVEEVRLDIAVATALTRTRLHAPDTALTLDASPCVVRASPARLDRAIANLLDNAVKWSPPSPPAPPVEVCVSGGRLRVRDHGPGIDEEDLPRVFDRFYRAPAARSMRGSGLGLAIVRDFAETHGGKVNAENTDGAGACLTLELPPLPMSEDERRLAEGVGLAAHEAPRIR